MSLSKLRLLWAKFIVRLVSRVRGNGNLEKIELYSLKITKLLVDLVLLGGGLILGGLPYLVNFYLSNFNFYGMESYSFLIIFLYSTGAVALFLVYEFRNILISIKKAHPFTLENVKRFKTISCCAGFISIEYLVKIFLYNSIFTLIIFMVFIIVALFALVLSHVFKQAYYVKTENDLTI